MRFRADSVVGPKGLLRRTSARPVPAAPGLLAMGKSLAKTLAGAALDGIRGREVLRTAEEAAQAIAICQGCEYGQTGRCQLCGCVLRWKTRLRRGGCPHPGGDKWRAAGLR